MPNSISINAVDGKKYKYIIMDDIKEKIETMIDAYREGKLVPIICDDVYTYKLDNKNVTLNSYIITNLHNYYKNFIMNKSEIEDIQQHGLYGVSIINQQVKDNSIFKKIYNFIIDGNSIRPGIGIRESVKKILTIGDFPLIITTSPFPIIESILSQEKYSSIWYGLNHDYKKSKLPQKCIYHLFGKSNRLNGNDWAYDEFQMLRFLKKLNTPENSPKELNLDDKVLLILGNNTPSWLFRFILCPLFGEGIPQKNDTRIGYYYNEGNDIDYTINSFLRDISFDKGEKMDEFLNELSKDLKPTAINSDDSNSYDVFLSYASEDKELAKMICDNLEEQGLKIWYDRKDIHEGGYFDWIINGLKKSSYYMPIITEKYIEKHQYALMVKGILDKNGININNLPLGNTDSDKILLDKFVGINAKDVSALHRETLIANHYFKDKRINGKECVLPVIVSCNNSVTAVYVEKMADSNDNFSKLPTSLFFRKQMFTFSLEQRKFEDGFDYTRYKKQNTNE